MKGFPTPNAAADTPSYLLFLFEDDTWAQWVLGALKDMCFEYNWYKSGDLETWEASEAFRLIIQQAPYNLTPADVPAPWWDEDSADDADDEMPKDAQPWYGQIVIIDDNLTFVENAFIWAVAGFIAYAGLPGAALSFVPIARKFVVTVKGNPLGGIIRFFADAVAIGEVDTYSPTDTAMEVQLMLPESMGMGLLAEDAPVFWAELLPDNPHDLESVSATIVRSRLSENDFSPVSLRYNPDTDTVQYTPDGGTTWVDDPADDPRVGAKFIKPLKTGIDIRCRSSASMVKWLRNFIEYETGVLTAGAEITAVANAGLALFDILAPWAILINLIIDVAGTIFGIGAGALSAAFDEDTYDLLLCIFYCNIENDGAVTDDEFAQIQTDIADQLNTTAALVMALILDAQGRVGLQNAGTLYEVEDADCGACECAWCYTFDFELTDGGFTSPPIGGFTYGHWVSGNGWVSDAPSAGEALYLTLTGIDIPHLTSFVSHTDFNFTCGAGVGSGNYADIRLSGVIQHAVNDTFSSPGGDHPISFTGDYHVDEILFNPSGTLSPCVITLKSLTLRGTGDNPFGDDNC